MSFKATNLSYEAQEPAFLRRLRGQHGGGDSDRHERPIARPRRAKDAYEDDAPTYVDEETNNTLSKEEYEAIVSGEKPEANSETPINACKGEVEKPAGPETAITETTRAKQDVTEVGTIQKKRKAAKVVGGDEEPEGDASVSKDTKKPRKKAKAVKLSFGVDE